MPEEPFLESLPDGLASGEINSI